MERWKRSLGTDSGSWIWRECILFFCNQSLNDAVAKLASKRKRCACRKCGPIRVDVACNFWYSNAGFPRPCWFCHLRRLYTRWFVIVLKYRGQYSFLQGKQVVTGSDDCTLRIWSPKMGSCVHSMLGWLQPIIRAYLPKDMTSTREGWLL